MVIKWHCFTDLLKPVETLLNYMRHTFRWVVLHLSTYIDIIMFLHVYLVLTSSKEKEMIGSRAT